MVLEAQPTAVQRSTEGAPQRPAEKGHRACVLALPNSWEAPLHPARRAFLLPDTLSTGSAGGLWDPLGSCLLLAPLNFLFFFLMLWIETRVLCVLGEQSTPELRPKPFLVILKQGRSCLGWP